MEWPPCPPGRAMLIEMGSTAAWTRARTTVRAKRKRSRRSSGASAAAAETWDTPPPLPASSSTRLHPSLYEARRGAIVYQTTCGNGYCHGGDGIEGSAPDHPEVIPPLSDTELIGIIENGTGYMGPVEVEEAGVLELGRLGLR